MTTSAGRILEGKEAKNDGNDDAIMSVGARLQAYVSYGPLILQTKTWRQGRILEGKEAKNDGNDDAIMSVGARLQAYVSYGPLILQTKTWRQKHSP